MKKDTSYSSTVSHKFTVNYPKLEMSDILSPINKIPTIFIGKYDSFEDIPESSKIIGSLVLVKDVFYYYTGYWISVDHAVNYFSIVNKFINKFKSKYSKEIEYIFLEGNCYWFARILAERFNGIIYYNQIDNHFATLIDDILYDITGEISKNGFESWVEYKKKEPGDAARIYRDCILKLDSDEIDYDNNTCNGVKLKIYNIMED